MSDEPTTTLPLTQEEISWLSRAQAGDPEAFNLLQATFEPPIHSFVRRLINDSEQVYDVVQDVFLALFKNIQQINPPEKLRPFLYRVARNRCYDMLRRRGRFDITALDDDPATEWVSYQAAEDVERPEDLAHWLLLHMEVQDAMLGLPEMQRQALILYAEEGLTYAEIAEAMNVSIGTVKSRIYYAKRGLRSLLRPEIVQALDWEFAQVEEPTTEAIADIA